MVVDVLYWTFHILEAILLIHTWTKASLTTLLLLKFPNIDHITEDIVRCTDDCVLFKVHVACGFRNLRVDPVDSLKFRIKWNGSYYVDLAVAFGWTHGSATFQILSDAIGHIVAKADIKIH